LSGAASSLTVATFAISSMFANSRLATRTRMPSTSMSCGVKRAKNRTTVTTSRRLPLPPL